MKSDSSLSTSRVPTRVANVGGPSTLSTPPLAGSHQDSHFDFRTTYLKPMRSRTVEDAQLLLGEKAPKWQINLPSPIISCILAPRLNIYTLIIIDINVGDTRLNLPQGRSTVAAVVLCLKQQNH